MSLTGVAALIAAVSFAVLACAGVYLTMRLTRLLGDAATLVRETREDQQVLLTRANAAVDRASTQLDRAEVVAASAPSRARWSAALSAGPPRSATAYGTPSGCAAARGVRSQARW